MTPQRRHPAVVVALDTMQGLQTARLLAARGVEVHGIVSAARHPFARTRSCRSVSVAATTEDLVPTLLDLADRLPAPAVLFPCQDAAVAEISRCRDELADGFLVVLPEHDVVMTLMEKASFHRHAVAHGLPVPRSEILLDRAAAERAAANLTFPCVLKPTARTTEWSNHTTAKAFEVGDADELLATYDEVAGWAESMVVQEWVVGPESNLFSVNAYFDATGAPLATFVAKKIRQWPVTTGQSSLGVECRDDGVLELALETFSTVPYRGLAYLEVKRDARSGKPLIIEPNIGRPTGRSAIAEAGGVELLDTMYCDAVGAPLPTSRTQTYGDATWIHLRRDLMASAVLWWRGQLTLSEWRSSMRGRKYHAVWDPHDPRPFLGDLIRVFGEAVAAVRHRRPPSPDHGARQ